MLLTASSPRACCEARSRTGTPPPQRASLLRVLQLLLLCCSHHDQQHQCHALPHQQGVSKHPYAHMAPETGEQPPCYTPAVVDDVCRALSPSPATPTPTLPSSQNFNLPTEAVLANERARSKVSICTHGGENRRPDVCPASMLPLLRAATYNAAAIPPFLPPNFLSQFACCLRVCTRSRTHAMPRIRTQGSAGVHRTLLVLLTPTYHGSTALFDLVSALIIVPCATEWQPKRRCC